ncbi:hypothetical protein E3N88_35848 [Mikania micrantha]|uniref:GH18 domain-containing protein n=1 Tax=Mikania micrantha TaxID=192012 RepID=A0A5N6M2F6_9ASTR|nr:hypothetical protein E3N88_35848 [Mikania micrantha]
MIHIVPLMENGIMRFYMSQIIKGGYWPSWAQTSFPPANINTAYFTHVYYAFLSLNQDTFELQIDATTASALNSFNTILRQKNPPVKTLFSVGGGSAGSQIFSIMASSPDKRIRFIASVIKLIDEFGFDGVDIDWEYPETQTDMDNFGLLLDELRTAVNEEAESTGNTRLLLSAATYYKPKMTFDEVCTYPVESINNNLDWINAMCYDYHGSWDVGATGTLAALYDPNGDVSTSDGLHSWIDAGIQPEKLIMGLALYGRTWKLKNPAVHGIGAPAVGLGPGNDGAMLYSEVQTFNAQNKATVVFDKPTVSYYSFSGTSWIGYDDVASVKQKIQYAKSKGIGGYFFWTIVGDQNWNISQQEKTIWWNSSKLKSQIIKGGYWPSWAQTSFPPANINTSYFTHVYYAFLSPDPNTFELQIDATTASALNSFNTIQGGLRACAGEFIEEHDFDGVDMDWEFPVTQTDMDNFGLLLDELRAAVNKEAESTGNTPLLLTAATNYKPEMIFDEVCTYPVESINNNLDWINAMCYDYHGSWDVGATGTLAALYDPNGDVSTSDGLQSWIDAGIQPEKLIMGLPLYGRTWKLKNPAVHGIGAPAVGLGPGNDGAMLYSEVQTFNAKNKATVVFDKPTVSYYSFSGTSWIGYDDVASVKQKIQYAKSIPIGGYFFWTIVGDLNWKISQEAVTQDIYDQEEACEEDEAEQAYSSLDSHED